jgi:hypothetical protein
LWFTRRWLWNTPSSGMWRIVALVRTNVSGEHFTFIIRVTRIGELGTMLAVTNNRKKLGGNFFAAFFGYYLLLTLFLTRRLFSPWWWRQHIPPKRRFLHAPHSVTSQKTALFLPWCLALPYLFRSWSGLLLFSFRAHGQMLHPYRTLGKMAFEEAYTEDVTEYEQVILFRSINI